MVLVIVHTPLSISKGLDHSYLHVYTCLLLCFILVLASLVLDFTTLDAFNGFMVLWLHLTPMRPCSDVTIWEVSLDAGLLHAYLPFFASRNDKLTMLVCATYWLSMHLFTLAYMSMHKSCLLVCCPCFNIMKL